MIVESLRARRTLLALWIFFALAALGFLLFLAGTLARSTTLMIFGAGMLALATVLYLFTQFWRTHGPAPTEAPPEARSWTPSEPEPAPERAPVAPAAPPRQNFEHLLTHTLERVEPLPATPAVPAAHHEVHVAAPGGGPTMTARAPFLPATKRRAEIVRGLPLMEQVFREEKPVTNPKRPGQTRGQCSGCDAILWAPAVRPLRIRCPRCSKTALLES